MAKKFIPYRCSKCVFGEYIHADSVWDSTCGATTDEECKELFAEDCTANFILTDLDSEV